MDNKRPAVTTDNYLEQSGFMKLLGRLGMRNSRSFAITMMLPTLLFMLFMTVYPMLSTVWYSLTNFRLLKAETDFIGINNFIQLFSNEYFRDSIWVTVKFTLFSVFFEMLLGLLLALYVNSIQQKMIQKTLRITMLLPYLFPTVTVCLSWTMMLSANYGVINQWLNALSLPTYNWFADVHTAFPMLVIIDVWQNTPFVFLLIYAALQAIPQDQYKAAKIDGAGVRNTFWYVTLPNLKTALALCAMLRTIDTFRIFDKVNLLTGGGPSGATTTISQYIYNYGIKTLKFGLGSAGALVMTIIVLILASIYIKNALRNNNG